jgi:HSP20 family molecular chaperone IbpA
MDSFFDLDDFSDLDIFDKDFMKKMQKKIDEMKKAMQSGQLKGNWDVKQIDKPGVKGYIIQGFFSTDKELGPLDPLEPIEPLRRRPMPKQPFNLPEAALKETRDPLTDVIEEEKTIKIYVELPGEEKDNIKADFKEDKVEVKAKNFYKLIDLPTKDIDKENISTKYTNGVLEISIPKKKTEFEPKHYRL